MIADHQTDTVYFSELLKTDKRYSSSCAAITGILRGCNIPYAFLPLTKDIWARDYMPIQVAKSKFIEYRYDPDYLQGKEKSRRNLKSFPDIICDAIALKTIKTDIILDGGNVVKSNNCVIMTDKVVLENKHLYTRSLLTGKLKELFEVDKLIFIPWDRKEEPYGHTDGMVRFIDNDTVLVSDFYKKEDTVTVPLEQAGLKVEYLAFNGPYKHKNRWAYINFLQTKDILLLPGLGKDVKEDGEALAQIKNHYPEYAKRDRIKQVDVSEIVKGHGALNCITWTISNDKNILL
jgi:agmatine deiminase